MIFPELCYRLVSGFELSPRPHSGHLAPQDQNIITSPLTSHQLLPLVFFQSFELLPVPQMPHAIPYPCTFALTVPQLFQVPIADSFSLLALTGPHSSFVMSLRLYFLQEAS